MPGVIARPGLGLGSRLMLGQLGHMCVLENECDPLLKWGGERDSTVHGAVVMRGM